jgi:hypothetical protein
MRQIFFKKMKLFFPIDYTLLMESNKKLSFSDLLFTLTVFLYFCSESENQ